MQKEKLQLFAFVALRMAIGWHFLFEGATKLLQPTWSSLPYLLDSQGAFQNIFKTIANTPWMLSTADVCNAWGLTIIGLFLILGFLIKYVSWAAIGLLCTYYISHPPLISTNYSLQTEGSYLFIDKNIIEILAILTIIVSPIAYQYSVDNYIRLFKDKK